MTITTKQYEMLDEMMDKCKGSRLIPCCRKIAVEVLGTLDEKYWAERQLLYRALEATTEPPNPPQNITAILADAYKWAYSDRCRSQQSAFLAWNLTATCNNWYDEKRITTARGVARNAAHIIGYDRVVEIMVGCEK